MTVINWTRLKAESLREAYDEARERGDEEFTWTEMNGNGFMAQKIADLLEWSESIGVEVVTLWMLSTDNLSRDPEELTALLEIIEDTVRDLAACGRWRWACRTWPTIPVTLNDVLPP